MIQRQWQEVLNGVFDLHRVKYYCELLNKLHSNVSPMDAERLQGEANELLSMHKSHYYIFWDDQTETYKHSKL